jgi:hypothetical protein
MTLRRAGRAVGALCAAGALAGTLGGCAQSNGTALAQQACRYVSRSLVLYSASLDSSEPQVAAAKRSEALVQLNDAIPDAATAAGEDGEYQALMATLAESDHLPESLLVHALSAQCASADAGDVVPLTPATTFPTSSGSPTSSGGLPPSSGREGGST